MANTIRLKRRAAGGAAGAPTTLATTEPAYNEQDDVLYLGKGDNGSGVATSILPVGGKGAFLDLTSAQTVAGIKTFSASPIAPTPTGGDSTTKVATTAFVQGAVTGGSVADGDKGDVVVSGAGTVWTIDTNAVTNAKAAQMATKTYKGRTTALTGNAEDVPVATLKTDLALVKADVGLGNADNTSDAAKPVSTAQQTALDLKINSTLIGAVNGVAALDGGGKVPAGQLPAYVDDVLEFANLAAFPATGASGIIYIAAATNKSYRWSGTVYVEIVSSPGTTDSVTEGSTNLYFTAARVLAVVLTGLSTATNAAITVTDTVLGALGKLQAQINDYAASTQTFTNKTMSGATNTFSAIPNTAITGLGTMSTQNATAVNISGGSVDNITLVGGSF